MSLFKSEISRHLTSPNPEVSRLSARTYPGMAHFANTGPNGTYCEKCRFFGSQPRTKKQPCSKFTLMMNGLSGGLIPPGTPSCKYYEVKQ